MAYVPLSHVNKSSQNWTVKTRAVRFCEFISDEKPPTRQRIDLILIDEEGTTIEAQVHESWHKRSSTLLREDRIYIIKYFQVLDAKESYRAVQHTSRIKFTAYTHLKEITDPPQGFPIYAHRAVPFDTLRSRINDHAFLSDTVGIVTACSHVRQQLTKNQVTKQIRNITISDGRETISVTLWGRNAEMFDAERCIEQSKEHPVVLLLCGMTCGSFNGRLTIEGSFLCKWYFDPEIPEAQQLKQRYGQGIGPVHWLGPPAAAPQFEKKTIAELASFNNPHEIDDKRFVVVAKIKGVVPDQSWWYLACTACNKKIQPHGAGYKCGNPVCTNTTGVPRYRLPVQAIDPGVHLSDDKATWKELVFFGPTAEEIIGAPVHELMDTGGGIGAALPPKIADLRGKSFELRVSVARSSLRNTFENPVITFQVNSIIRALGNDNDNSAISIQNKDKQAADQSVALAVGHQQHVREEENPQASATPSSSVVKDNQTDAPTQEETSQKTPCPNPILAASQEILDSMQTAQDSTAKTHQNPVPHTPDTIQARVSAATSTPIPLTKGDTTPANDEQQSEHKDSTPIPSSPADATTHVEQEIETSRHSAKRSLAKTYDSDSTKHERKTTNTRRRLAFNDPSKAK